MIKKTLLVLLVLVTILYLLNKLVYTEVPQSISLERLSEVKRYQIPIHSISFNDTDFADLKKLDTILHGNRVLMLGESAHNDGQTFMAKSRLVKYLHENLGYNVVLYEAGQYDTWLMNEEMNHQKMKIPADSIAGIGLFNFWWDNEESKVLLNYFLQTKRSSKPIEIAGFDIQFSGSLLNDQRVKRLEQFLSQNKIDLKDFKLLHENIQDLNNFIFPRYVKRKLDEKQKEQFLDELNQLKIRIEKLVPSVENNIYARYLNDMRGNYFRLWNFDSESMERMNYRDSLMAKNLIYQIDSVYPTEKIIVWCSNIQTFSSRYNAAYLPLGAYIKKKYENASYMLGFSSYARLNEDQKKVDLPGKWAVEHVFHQSKMPYFMINFKDIPKSSFLQNNFVSNLKEGVDENLKWATLLDGIFYIDINKNPTYAAQ